MSVDNKKKSKAVGIICGSVRRTACAFYALCDA